METVQSMSRAGMLVVGELETNKIPRTQNENFNPTKF